MPRKNKKEDHFVNVYLTETRELVAQHGPFGSRKFAERAETGIARGVDTSTHFTHVTTKKEVAAS